VILLSCAGMVAASSAVVLAMTASPDDEWNARNEDLEAQQQEADESLEQPQKQEVQQRVSGDSPTNDSAVLALEEASPSTGNELPPKAVTKKPVSRVRHSTRVLTNSNDTAQVSHVVDAHIAEIRACYDASLDRQPDLSGRVTIRFIVANGGVSRPEITKSTINKAVSNCIAKAIPLWEFPKLQSQVGTHFLNDLPQIAETTFTLSIR
jgi:hypothetical protein